MISKKSSNKINSKAQSGSNAGALVIIILVLISLYILFLPPEARDDLLAGGTGTGGSGSGGGSGGGASLKTGIILRENVGTIYEQDDDEKQYELPSFTISSETESGIIKSKSSIFIKSSAFQEIAETVDFTIDPQLSDNLILSFNVQKGEGRMTITLNGKTVFTGIIDSGSSPPIYLDEDELQSSNILEFTVEGPGIAFWRYNSYTITDLKITGDITDISGSENVQSLTLRSEDLQNIESARIRYLAECEERIVENFEVRMNGQRLFRGIPDCAIYSYLPIDSNNLLVGSNEFEFKLEKGTVLVDRLELQTFLEDPQYPIYYFDIDDKYFISEDEEEFCGKADGICPRGCEEDEDVDCCFERNDNYWCDVETNNQNDRCVSFVNDCQRCSSGYEDDSGDPPDKCVEDTDDAYCGDDTDEYCPAGCSALHDKDCCFAQGEEYYWCDDVPQTGLSSVCEQSVETAECDDCTYGYENEDGDSPDCSYTTYDDEEEETLDPDYEVTIKFVFPNKDQKKMEVLINGREIGINTAKIEYERDISDYMRSGSNSIELRPLTDLTVTEMRVTIE